MGLREIPVDRSVQRAVLATMRDLAATGSHDTHRLPLTDLTVAVAAQAAASTSSTSTNTSSASASTSASGSHWISYPGDEAH